MKLKITSIAIALVAVSTIAAGGVRAGYPHTNISPVRIVEGDTVRLSMILAEGTSSCVPSYPNASYTIEQQPEEIYPPNFKVYLSYTEVPPPSGICLTVMTNYGPRFTLIRLAAGNYTCLDKTGGNRTVATFRVLENDSMQYTVSTAKTLYSKGQDLDVTYTVRNNSTRTRRFDFNSGCQFDMVLRKSTGDTTYHSMRDMGCGAALTDITLQPGEEMKHVFSPIRLTEAYGPLTIIAQLIGYQESTVSKTITVNQITGIGAGQTPGYKTRGHAWQSLPGAISLRLDQGQTVALEVFSPAGSRVECMSSKRFYPAGVHRIAFGEYPAAHGILVLRVKGERFSRTTKLIPWGKP